MYPMLLAAGISAAPITTGDLLREMTDLRHLGAMPAPHYRTIQLYSYDRRSVAPYRDGWYTNHDGFGGEPIPGVLAVLDEPGEDRVGRYLLADIQGPGALVRLQTAAINGSIKLWLDDAEIPLYDGPAHRFFQDLYSHLAMQQGLLERELTDGFRQNMAGYFPIPFARRCRIEWTGRVDQVHFYAVQARVYEPGTAVQTFSVDDLRTYAAEIETALAVLRDGRRWQPPTAGEETAIAAEVAPGGSSELWRRETGGCIQTLTLKVTAADRFRALRQVILKGYFDGSQQPQIEAPIGDFFGSGPGLNPYDSVPFVVEPDGTMSCRFPMPFAAAARFEAVNLGAQPVTIDGTVNVREQAWDEERSLHYHARWSIDHDIVAGGGAEVFDLPILAARGRGVYVGTAVMLLNPSGVPTSGGNWWGEGDEKFWVDDDTFPSIFGGGSEDYFNYSWSRPELWSTGYSGQTLNTGPANRGFVSNCRWHILDPIPFRTGIDFCLELWHHSHTPGFSYGRLALFYAAPELRDYRMPVSRLDVTLGLELPTDYEPVAAGQAQGAVFFQGEEMLDGAPRGVSIADGREFARGRALRWSPQVEGESIELSFELAAAGRYQLVPVYVQTPHGGRVEATVDAVPLGPVCDLFTPHHTRLDNYWLRGPEGDLIELTAGRHTLRLTCRGKRDESAGMEVGLDFVWLRPGR